MKKFFGKLLDVCFFTIVGLYYGLIGGLVVSMTVFAARHAPFWCLGFTAFFALFHLDDFREFYRKRNWMAFAGRFVVLFSITSFIVSIFVFALSDFERLDIYDLLIFVVGMPVSLAAATFWTLLENFGAGTRLYLELRKIVDGLRVIGVLWKN